ncbi:transferrin-binding protein-like solute binding protein [Sphingomonas sp. S2-65]|uniref:transferrin-binding protein-like solute binding protein n=1 Tax=Sphingomonas sp. S2-65 TaxID=2903960 RepID=UPI001F373E4D|nr:transferrin-binding protein-like solute binding protein [Sphingomonas sp. S2-65]UYY59865.1 transferrin-binding protein-like solute binding protein [Sphingomonas sp. S2-65]
MIRRHMIMSAAMATLALAGCSGGNDDDDASPTPTPTTSPTPTPTASPTYTAFPLAAATEFSTINATTSYTGDPATSAVTLGVAGTEMLSSRLRLATSNAIDTAEYVIRENTEESRFKKANLTTAPAPTAPEFVFRINDATTLGKFSQLEFLNNTIPPATTGGAPVITNDTGLQFTQLSYANWWRGDSTAGAKRIAYTVFGYPTVLTDMPTTGTQAYTSRVNGRLISVTGATTAITRVGGTATVSVNFATGLVSVTMTLTTTDGTTTTPYGTFTAQGAIGVGNNQFTGSFRSGSPLDGTIAGGFFGSQGKEIGITFAGSGTVGAAQQRLVGEIVGKK